MASKAAGQPQKDMRPALTDTDLLSWMVRGHTFFETVVKQDQLPLVWESELGFARRIVTADTSGKMRFVVPETLQACMENLAAVGLTLNPIKQHLTIIPRYNKQTSVWEAALLFMYRGLVYLATQAGVHDIDVDVVYKSDTFKLIRKSDGAHYEHEINITIPRDGDNQFQGAYVAARMPHSGERKVEWVPAEDIYKMRDASDSYRDKDGKLLANAPWARWFDEQAKKSALKRATKRWEEATDNDTRWQRLQRAVALDHRAETGGRTFEGQAEPIEVPKLTMEQITAIEGKAAELYADEAAKKHFLTKICNAYGREALSELAAQHYNEILERIKAVADGIAKKRAKDARDKKAG